MKVAYTAGKYRSTQVHGIVRNIRAAEAVAIELWRMGFAVLTPHLNSALLDGAVPELSILNGDIELMRRCDLVVMLPRWEESVGATAERERALEMGMAVYEWPADRERLAVEARSDAGRDLVICR